MFYVLIKGHIFQFIINVILVPSEFLWSEWGVPDKLCDVGTQQRTTMCGSLRRRLPNLPGRDSDEPASVSVWFKIIFLFFFIKFMK